MTREEFHSVRERFGKTQKEIAHLLGISLKAVQSFEQGWRKIPSHVERQLLFLSSLKKGMKKNLLPCWEFSNCRMEDRMGCPAWEFRAGQFCWLVTGTYCKGRVKKTWDQKLKSCKKCEMFRSFLKG